MASPQSRRCGIRMAPPMVGDGDNMSVLVVEHGVRHSGPLSSADDPGVRQRFTGVPVPAQKDTMSAAISLWPGRTGLAGDGTRICVVVSQIDRCRGVWD